MDLMRLTSMLQSEPAFRFQQIQQLVWQDLIDDWDSATTLPVPLREKLQYAAPLTISATVQPSADRKTLKALFDCDDGLSVESVLMKHEGRRTTVCVSSQVGCPLSCSFCATGKIGFRRSLTAYEIVSQVIFFARFLKKSNEKLTNIVFMGMGEPFLNYDNVLAAIRILNDEDGFNLGARRMSISTAGIVEGIEKLSEEPLEVNLAISLHAPNNHLRSNMMPVNKKYPIEKVMQAVSAYIQKKNRRVMIEYIMIKNVNDSKECANELAKLVARPLLFVNLISYNPTGIFRPSSPQRIRMFQSILEEHHIPVTRRYRFGDDIDAACGQLAGKNTT